MSKEKVPIKIVVPIIVVTWVLSLISALAIVYMMPSLIPIRSEQIGEGLITSDKIADEAIITVKLADGNVTSAKILDGNITAVDIEDGSIVTIEVADGAITTDKIADGNVTEADLGDNAVTTDKLAPYAIPFNSTWGIWDTTEGVSSVDMANMSVTLTLNRMSHLLIMFSARAWASNPDTFGYVAAKINDTITAFPGSVELNPRRLGGGNTLYSTMSFIFHRSVGTGTHTIKIKWWTGPPHSPLYVSGQTLTVIALPA